MATLSREMDWLFQSGIRASYQDTQVSKNTIVKNLQELYPNGKITYWQSSQAPYLCNIIHVEIQGQRHYVFANPYTGDIQGSTTLTFQRFFRDLHYFLFIPFQLGYFTVLVFGFMLFISTVTALLFYKKWWRKLFTLKRGKGPVALFRGLHRLIGIWSVPFTILFSITGMWYFMERTNIGSIKETANIKIPKIPELDSTTYARLHYTMDYDSIIKVAQKSIPNLIVKDIVPPRKIDNSIYLTGKSDVPLVRSRANRIYMHPVTYEVVGLQNAKKISAVVWLNDIADPLHFGYWGGLVTKVIWFFAGLGISFLVGTGIWISLKRKIKATKKAGARRLGKWKYPNILMLILMFGFMYYTLFSRYTISAFQFGIISIGWILILCFGWLIYAKKITEKE